MYSIKKINEVSITSSIYALKINNRLPFEEFFDEYKKNANLSGQLAKIQSILTYLGKDEDEKIPPNKFKALQRNRKDGYIDYEIKTKDLRVYLFRDSRFGKIIVLGGMKKNQKKDLQKLRNHKHNYFNQQNITVLSD